MTCDNNCPECIESMLDKGYIPYSRICKKIEDAIDDITPELVKLDYHDVQYWLSAEPDAYRIYFVLKNNGTVNV